MHQPYRPVIVINDDQRADVEFFQRRESAGRQHRFFDRFRSTGHDVVHRQFREVARQVARHIALGDDATQTAILVQNTDAAEMLAGKNTDCFRHGSSLAD
ncbi:hypothetical protein D3C80_1925340 [compost metagenome]